MTDYKDTVFLPQTTFPLKADISREEGIRQIWQARRNHRSGVDYFQGRVWDGPPYANGDIHMGHALNKIIKDILVRHLTNDEGPIEFVPGWDCHGLPIESQVEKNLIAEGKSKDDLTPVEFRGLCRAYAQKWVDTQREQFKSLGIDADWDNPYLTMDFANEAKILEVFYGMLNQGLVHRGTRPVLWSALEETSLAEAEVNYKDIKTSQVWVRFPVRSHENTSFLVWTTTPWSLPANKFLAFNPELKYVGLKVKETSNPLLVVGEVLILAESRVKATCETLGITDYDIQSLGHLQETANYYHPLHNLGFGWQFNQAGSIVPADFVTDDAGTGIVHIAPEFGPEDYELYFEVDPEAEFEPTVDSKGRYLDHVPFLAGESILNPTPKGEYIFEFTNAKIIKALIEAGRLAFTKKETQSLPHSWRSHTPLFYRATDQWFIDLDQKINNGPSLRDQVLKAADSGVEFEPQASINRFKQAVTSRPDWLVSRQRLWGTPMALFVHKETKEPLVDHQMQQHILSVMADKGGDVWWTTPKEEWFKTTTLNPDDYDQVFDVLDVWFDSGCAASFHQPRNLYDYFIEGSDQHRGWFQSSAFVNSSTNQSVLADVILTHGFVLDHKGEKMSKSKGNVVDPLAKAQEFGNDVLRLWVASSDFTNDLRVGDEILRTSQDTYRKVRNTFRYLLGVLTQSPQSRLAIYRTFKIEEPVTCYIIRELKVLQRVTTKAYDNCDFKEVVRVLSSFGSRELSSIFFDMNKDVLYCDELDSPRRLQYLGSLELIFRFLVRLWYPILPFLVEEALQTLEPGCDFYEYNHNTDILLNTVDLKVDPSPHWDHIKKAIDLVNSSVETERRRENGLTNLMDMRIIFYGEPQQVQALTGLDLAALFKCSQAVAVVTNQEPHVVIDQAMGKKCARSRKITMDVGLDPDYPDLSVRDAVAVRAFLAKRDET